jgi:site-specific DNA recombinase
VASRRVRHHRPAWPGPGVVLADPLWPGRDPDTTTQPEARRSYPLRSRVRCRICQRRMRGVARRSTAYYAGDPAATYTYYQCSHDVANPRHAAAHPDHPRTVTIRQDLLQDLIQQFLAERIFGPERAALAASQIPHTDTAAAEQNQCQRQRLVTELARIDLARRSQIMQIETLSTDPADQAAAAMRARCSARFAELHTERQAIQAQLDTLDAANPQPAADLALLDDLPLLAAILEQHPGHLLAALYQAFDIQCLYKPDMHQVTIFATITTSTPGTVAAIISDATPGPAHAATPAPDAPGRAQHQARKTRRGTHCRNGL